MSGNADTRLKWSYQDNRDVIKCFLVATDGTGKRYHGYGDRMADEWNRLRPDRTISKGHLLSQRRYIQSSKKISDIEEDAIRKQLEEEGVLERRELGVAMADETDDPVPLTDNATVHQPSHSQTRGDAAYQSHQLHESPERSLTPDENIHGSTGSHSPHMCENAAQPREHRGNASASHLPTEALLTKLRGMYERTSITLMEDRAVLPTPRHVPRKCMGTATAKVNKAIQELLERKEPDNINDLNNMVYAGARLALGMVTDLEENSTASAPNVMQENHSAPPWQERLSRKINNLRADVSRLSSLLPRAELDGNGLVCEKLTKIYGVRTLQETRYLLEMKKMELQAAAARLRRHKTEHQRRNDNNLFRTNEKLFYRRLNTPAVETTPPEVTPSKEEIEAFWSGVLDNPLELSHGVWLDNFRQSCQALPQQENTVLSREALHATLKKMSNWKSPGRDNIHTYWWKKFTAVHQHVLKFYQRILDGLDQVPQWFTFGITTLIPKKGDLSKPGNYRPITCLPTISKIFTAIINTCMWHHINENSILGTEQTGCTPGRGGCSDQLLIDRMVLEDACSRQRNLSTCWVDFRKAYDSVAHSWLVEMLQQYRFAANITSCIRSMMAMWRTQLLVPGPTPRDVTKPIQIRKGIFQGDSLSPLLFCLALNPISAALNRTGSGYQCGSTPNTVLISHLYYMDDLKLFAANTHQLSSMVCIVESMGADIGMQFNAAKCNWLEIKHGKPTTPLCEYLPTQSGAIDHLQPENDYQYLGIAESAHFNNAKMKDKTKCEFSRRLKLICQTQLSAIHMVKAINTYVVPIVLYTLPAVDWNKADIAVLDRMTRKELRMQGAHHPKASAIRVHLPRDIGGRGVLSISHLQQRTIVRLARYLQQHQQIPQLEAVRRHHEALPPSKSIMKRANEILVELDIPSLQAATKEVTKAAVHKRDLARLRQMPLHGQYWTRLEQSDLDVKLSMQWMRSPSLRPTTESNVIAIQDQVLQTRNYRAYVIKDLPTSSDMCRVCSEPGETLDHVIGSCSALARTAYIRRHDSVVKLVHWALSRRLRLPCGETPHTHQLQHVAENDEHKLLWEVPIPTDIRLRSNRPDLVIRSGKKVQLLDISIPLDINVTVKYADKKGKYTALAVELRRIWGAEEVDIVPIIIGALGGATKQSWETINAMCNPHLRAEQLQQQAILGTLQIVKQVLAS